jgi:hypothetical protein
MTLPTPIDPRIIGGYEDNHEDWHENIHVTSNLIFSGTGTPETNVVAPVGSIFLRTDGGADSVLYTKESGTGNTGWSAMAGVP